MAHLIKFRTRPVLYMAILAFLAISLYVKTPLAHAGEPEIDEIPSVNSLLSPVGKLLLDASTGLPAVTPLTVNFVRTPDTTGPDGKGRYLIAVNSGYGVEFTSKSKGQQTLAVIDLNLAPDPKVI